MQQIANLIQKKIPNYSDFASCAYSMPYNHQWHKHKYAEWDKKLGGTSFANLKNRYQHQPLNRQMIIDLFSQGKYYDGFLCAMVWGSVGNNIRGLEIFKSVFASNHEEKINNVVGLLQNGDLDGAYNSLYLLNGKNKIVGLGEAFFTKLLYFTGAHMTHLKIQPLIFDSNMRVVYEKMCTKSFTNSFEQYKDYCKKMEDLKRCLLLPTAGHVEALLFCPGIRDFIFA